MPGWIKTMGEKILYLSKSKYLAGLQCHKLLWYEINASDDIPEADDGTQETFRQGKLVGDLAKQLHPDGIEIPRDHLKPRDSFGPTQDKLKLRKPLFEAGFLHNNAYAFIDILEPSGKDLWNIVEVKSSTEIKDVHLEDLALQLFVCEGAGLKISKCFLLLVNNDYVRKGEVDPAKYFTKTDVTDQVRRLSVSVQKRFDSMARDALLGVVPDVRIGLHCLNPYECALKEKCWDFVPEQSIFTLYRMHWKKKFELFDGGALELKELPEDAIANEKHRIQTEACRSGEPHIDRKAIQVFLKKLRYPLYFLDFESYSGAIPMLDGLKPYQQVPFQFSLHVIEKEGAEPKHWSYLAEGRSDPRRAFLENLKPLLGNKGSVVVFNRTFEEGVLRKCCEFCPEHQAWLDTIEPRIVDLLEPFQAFDYYHPDQCGSASIKSVLPAITGKGYEGLEIQDGGAASREYMRVTFGDVEVNEQKRVRENLEKYCGMDTMAMVWVVQALQGLTLRSI